MGNLRIGVIGLGFGQYHVKTLANMAGVDLVSAADQNINSLAEYANKYHLNVYEDGIVMMEKENLDAVSLCVSPRWRLPLIKKAVDLDIAMFIEKPWASNMNQAIEIAEICKLSKQKIMTGFSFRYLPAFVKLRELIPEILGVPYILNGEYLFDWLPHAQHWLWDKDNGNGFINENSCHLFDAVCNLLGEPISVMADLANFRGSPSAEVGVILLHFKNGSIASLSVGGLGVKAFSDFPRINLITENGQAHLYGTNHIWEKLTWAKRNFDEVQSIQLPAEQFETTRYTHAFDHFFDCIRNDKTPSAGIEDGIRAVAIAESVYASAQSGQKVNIPPYQVGDKR